MVRNFQSDDEKWAINEQTEENVMSRIKVRGKYLDADVIPIVVLPSSFQDHLWYRVIFGTIGFSVAAGRDITPAPPCVDVSTIFWITRLGQARLWRSDDSDRRKTAKFRVVPKMIRSYDDLQFSHARLGYWWTDRQFIYHRVPNATIQRTTLITSLTRTKIRIQ